MKLELCAMYDNASQMFGRPFFMAATGQAVRSFHDEIKRKDDSNDLYKHPDDFTLYHFGSFNDGDGSFDLFDSPTLLVRGKDVQSI